MSLGERDPHTGHMTTGHQWNGIKELNTNVPGPVWFFLSAAFLVSVVMWFLLPAWPLGSTYTLGVLKVDERAQLRRELVSASAGRQELTTKIASSSYEKVARDSALLGYVRSAGRPLFNDNCSACHGTGGTGGPGYPNLADKAWLWGSEDEAIEDTIMETLRVGINGRHPDARTAQMLSFGRDGIIDRKSIFAVIDYLRSINERKPEKLTTKEQLETGAGVFAENCASCHGEDGKGNKELGSPDLTDTVWIYGSSRQALYETIWKGRQGHMPSWEARLTEADRKLLTLYVLDLNAARQTEP